MSDTIKNPLSSSASYQLTDVIKTRAQFEPITPRWLTKILEWKSLEAGVFRLNKVIEGNSTFTGLTTEAESDSIPKTYANYDSAPREYKLENISVILPIPTNIIDTHSTPYNQINEQLRIVIEALEEKQEDALINSCDYGLLNNVEEKQTICTLAGPPTPDDLDELLTKVWKRPSFFLAHPRAIAAFGRECTMRGVPPVTMQHEGSPVLTWRGVPIFPTDKLSIDDKNISETTNILLVRTGEVNQGVIGLNQANLQGEQSRGLSVRFMGINNQGIASYLLSIYCSAAVLADDAIAVLKNVEVGKYHDYSK